MQGQKLARMSSIYDEPGLVGEDSIETPLPSIKAYKYRSMDDFCHIVSCHISRLHAFLGNSRSEKGDPRKQCCTDDNDDGDGGEVLDLNSCEVNTGSRPCQHSQPINSRSCQDIPDDIQLNSQGSQYENGSQYILFIIDNYSFQKDFLDGDPIRHTRLFYNPHTNILIIKMPVPTHEQAAEEFGDMIKAALTEMGLRPLIAQWRTATMTAPDGTRKEADGAWGPRRPPRGSPKKPSVVLEVGFSDSYARLRRNAQYWIDPARQTANVAIGINIHMQRPEITIDIWEWDPVRSRPKTTNHMVIKRSGGKIHFDPNDHEPCLIIPFHQMFRRPGQLNAEQDIMIRTQALIEFVCVAWEMQFGD